MPNDNEDQVEFDLRRLREVREASAGGERVEVGDSGEHSDLPEDPSRSGD